MNISFENLKHILLGTNSYIENEFLEKYINLILNNLSTEYKKYETQAHHVIPVFHYGTNCNHERRKKIQKTAEEDPNNFKINLLYKDHVLAHYYLSLCACDDRAVFANCLSLRRILENAYFKKSPFYIEESEFLLKLDGIQDAYTKAAKLYQANLTEEERNKISQLHSVIQKEVLKNRSEEEKEDINKKRKKSWDGHSEEQKINYSNSKKEEVLNIWRKRTPEERERIRQKIIETKRNKPQEEKDEAVRKQQESYYNSSAEKRAALSQKRREYWANLDPEKKKERGKKIWEKRRKNQELKNKNNIN